MRFSVGEAVVDAVTDFEKFDLPLDRFLPEADPTVLAEQRALLEPVHIDLARGLVHLAVRTFVVRVGGRTVLVDTCVGEHKERPARPDWHRRDASGFLARLAAAGVAPEQVDVVFCTHLHADHVGWNTRLLDGRWVPTFPNARYLVGRTEMAHWQAELAKGPANHGAFEDSVLPVVAAGQVDLVDDGHEPAAGMVLCPLPGHTPGQMGLSLGHGAESALFCGDAVHSPVQVLHPGLSTAFCTDRAAAASTRAALLAGLAESGGWLAPAHFRSSGRARIRAAGAGFFPDFALPA
jgi:glyoxylase-like metal-dependent hydrolase (beta-lactamase superfamily II)